MRNIERNVVTAVRNCLNYKSGNTRVEVVNNEGVKNVFVYLFGKLIYKIVNGDEFFTLAGWNTQTTRNRLHALGVDVNQKNFAPIYNGVEIDTNAWYKA